MIGVTYFLTYTDELVGLHCESVESDRGGIYADRRELKMTGKCRE